MRLRSHRGLSGLNSAVQAFAVLILMEGAERSTSVTDRETGPWRVYDQATVANRALRAVAVSMRESIMPDRSLALTRHGTPRCKAANAPRKTRHSVSAARTTITRVGGHGALPS